MCDDILREYICEMVISSPRFEYSPNYVYDDCKYLLDWPILLLKRNILNDVIIDIEKHSKFDDIVDWWDFLTLCEISDEFYHQFFISIFTIKGVVIK